MDAPDAKRRKVEPTPPLASAGSAVDRPANAFAHGSLLSEKYRPTKLIELIGYAPTDQNPLKQLKAWLHSWKSSTAPSPVPALLSGATRPNGCLLTGPPGVGKTTAAKVAAQECGFVAIEFNASDTRSQSSLRDSVSHMLSSRSMSEFATGTGAVLIMDEVDGMSSGDRGGLAELCRLIKASKVPVICIANDKYKVRSLNTHCLQLGLRRPTSQQIQARLAQIAYKEGISIAEPARRKLADESNGDVRQAINLLQMWSTGAGSVAAGGDGMAHRILDNVERSKDVVLGPIDAVPALLSDTLSGLHAKLDRFFMDPSAVPLFVQENYLSVVPGQRISEAAPLTAQSSHAQALRLFADAAESICLGDVLDKGMRRDQHWKLLPEYGVVSSIRPCVILKGRFAPKTAASWAGGGLQFPQWFGKNSTTGKRVRLLNEVQHAACLHTGRASSRATRLDYCDFLSAKLIEPLKSGVDGIPEILGLMEAYSMQKETRDAVIELYDVANSGGTATMCQVPATVKSALTRRINKARWRVAATAPRKRTVNTVESAPGAFESNEVLDESPADEDGAEIDAEPGDGAAAVAEKKKQKKPAKPRKRKTATKGVA